MVNMLKSIKIIKKFITSDGGAFTAIFAVMAPIFIAGAGLAIDVGFWYSSKRDLQNAADAAALAGGYELLGTNSQASAIVEANNVAVRNGGIGAQATTTFPANNRIQVIVQATSQTFFIGNFISNPPVITASATAQLTQAGITRPPACLNLLSPTGEGLRIDGNGLIDASGGCQVQVNSADQRAVVVNGAGRLLTNSVCVNGGVVSQSQSSISSNPITGCPQINNPFAFLEPFIAGLEALCPDEPQSTLVAPVRTRRGATISRFLRSPGAGINTQFTINNGGDIEFSDRLNPGQPHPVCFDLTVRAGGTLIIGGNMVFLNGARLIVQAGANVTIRPPQVETPQLQGLSIVASINNNATHEIRGGGSIVVTSPRGISVPGGEIDINGNSRIVTSPNSSNLASLSVTARSLSVGGNSEFRLGANPPNQPLQPRPTQAATVQLIN